MIYGLSLQSLLSLIGIELWTLKKFFKPFMTAQPFIKGYFELAEKINSKEKMGSVIQETEDLTKQIEAFFKTDPYMSQAIYENSRVPHADWDEDVGGS